MLVSSLRALLGQASVPRSLAVIQSHPSPGGCASRSLPVTSRSAFQKLIWRVRDKPGPKGAVSRCPRPWDAEKGEGEEKKEGRQEGQARLWRAISEHGKLLSLCAGLCS